MLAFSIRKSIIPVRAKSRIKPLKEALKKSFLHDLSEGLKIILFDKKIKFVVYIFFILSSMIGAIYVVGVVFIQEVLKSMTRDVGMAGMYLFAGLLVGSYLYGKMGRGLNRAKTVSASLFLSGIFITLFVIHFFPSPVFLALCARRYIGNPFL